MSNTRTIGTTDRLRVLGTNLVLFLLLLGVVTVNKRFLRPHVGPSALAQVVTGSLPNFAVAFFVTLCAVGPVRLLRPRFGRLLVYVAALIVFTLLTLEELTGALGASKRFDTYDIAASALGAFVACFAFELLARIDGPRVNQS